jgi:hypothetical protein
MSRPTSGDEIYGMNFIDEYQAEIDYRREQMLRGRGTLRQWLRSRRASAGASPRNRSN